jgi:hypothetical protein
MSSEIDQIWQIEEQLWMGGVELHEKIIADECLMAFPGVGLMDRRAAVEGLKQAPRWCSVDMQMRKAAVADSAVVLGYRAEARRDESEPYRAWCTSTYRKREPHWLLIQHQQTMAD